MGHHNHEVLPGGLSSTDHERIFDLADKGWKAPRIARDIRKDSGTVQWFMYRHGLAAPRYHNTEPYMRGGRLVTPFDRAEDDFITAQRIVGHAPTKIADLANAEFGRNRSKHTISCRLVMLAAREEA